MPTIENLLNRVIFYKKRKTGKNVFWKTILNLVYAFGQSELVEEMSKHGDFDIMFGGLKRLLSIQNGLLQTS